MMLEIINSCLCNSLHHNPNLVYALLYKRELFEQFRTHPSFQDIMQNLDTVSFYFYFLFFGFKKTLYVRRRKGRAAVVVVVVLSLFLHLPS